MGLLDRKRSQIQRGCAQIKDNINWAVQHSSSQHDDIMHCVVEACISVPLSSYRKVALSSLRAVLSTLGCFNNFLSDLDSVNIYCIS